MDQTTIKAGLEGTDPALDARSLLQQTSPPPPKAVQDWLGQLGMLLGVPFENLVPDARMLPTESMRFFYVDTNWIESLVDGALSTGVHSDRDIRYHRVMRTVVSKVTDEAAGKLRMRQRGELAENQGEPPETLVLDSRVRAGFVMRSALVSGWPGMAVQAFDGTDENTATKLTPLRIERLAPDVLLAIFADVPRMVVVHEPEEGLHFGTGNGRGIVRQGARAGVLDIRAMAVARAAASAAGKFAKEMVDRPDKQKFIPE